MMKKRVTIPLQENNNLVLSALHSLRNSLTMMNLDKNEEVQYAIFDLSGLMGIFSGEFKVTIEIDQDKMDSFASMFGVDFPQFADIEIVDIEKETVVQSEQVQVGEDNGKPQYFEHLAYIEDGNLSFAIRSNKPFIGADDEGADPQDDDSPRFHFYKHAKPGEAIFFEGTTFAAVPTDDGWAIIENGEVVEEVDLD